jgi:hypothetical protein
MKKAAAREHFADLSLELCPHQPELRAGRLGVRALGDAPGNLNVDLTSFEFHWFRYSVKPLLLND